MVDDKELSRNLSYKEIHERFVSDLNGTSLMEVSLVVSTAPVTVLLRTFMFSLLLLNEETKLPGWLFCFLIFVVDYVTLIVPVLLGFTVLADHVILLIATCLSLSLGLLFLCSARSDRAQTRQPSQFILSSDMSGKRPFIGNFRAYVLVATTIAILAVDFVIFPRRLAKAETFGSGLMDVGVGSFIISNAIVSPEGRGASSGNTGSISPVIRSVKSSVPLLALGIIRFISVKGSDYQEHVSEYGTHWNFFFTLFIVRVLSTVLLRLLPGRNWYGITGLALALLYQYLLSCTGLRAFVLHGRYGDDSRHGFVDGNREGLCSCAGYLALYFIGVQVGKFIFQQRSTVGQWIKAFFVLVTAGVVFYLLLEASQLFISPISRRMANLSFVLWQVAYNIQILSSFLFCDILITVANNKDLLQGAVSGGCEICYPTHKQRKNPCACLLAAINRNQLLYFLLANLLTGAVNFSVETVFCSSVKGFLIVCTYLLVLNILVFILHLHERSF